MNDLPRRDFLKSALLLGGASAMTTDLSAQTPAGPERRQRYATLDMALKQPVLRRELFPSPVIMESIELLRDRDNFICRIRSKEGAEGISIGHPFISKNSYPMFVNLLKGHFEGKDARDLDELIFNAAEGSVKNQGVPLCVQLATMEFAILDLLGNIADLPAGRLLGEVLNPVVKIYLGHHLGHFRKKEPEESLAIMQEDVEATGAKAVKLRAGTGDQLGLDLDNAPGRTEKLIRMAREFFGDEMVLMIDGNGTYSVREAVRIGRLLEEYNYAFYEEPVPWNWYMEQKQVERALDIPMAGGEEEFSRHLFRYLVGNEVFQIVQPDLFYYGGMVRTMQVARMAEAVGLQITPHISGGGLGYLYMLHMVSVCPAAYEFHEFKMLHTRDANGTMIPVEFKGKELTCTDGTIKIPTGSGLGVIIDPDYIRTHQLFNG